MPREELPAAHEIPAAGKQNVRIIVQEPGKLRVLRTLELLTSAVEERMWIADAYFLSMATLTRGLESAARDGVDVRILMPTPATNDQPPVGTLSRVGYRRLLESGVRIFEYGGPMMHAKTTVADARFCRVGSTNLNVAGLVTNWEIDLFAEDADFGARMERMFEEDLDDAREVILESRGPGRGLGTRPESPATKPEQQVQLRPRETAPEPWQRPRAWGGWPSRSLAERASGGTSGRWSRPSRAPRSPPASQGRASRRRWRGRWPPCLVFWEQPASCAPPVPAGRHRPNFGSRRNGAKVCKRYVQTASFKPSSAAITSPS